MGKRGRAGARVLRFGWELEPAVNCPPVVVVVLVVVVVFSPSLPRSIFLVLRLHLCFVYFVLQNLSLFFVFFRLLLWLMHLCCVGFAFELFSKVKLTVASFFCTLRFLFCLRSVNIQLCACRIELCHIFLYLFLLLHPHFLEPRPASPGRKKVLLSPSSFCGSSWRAFFFSLFLSMILFVGNSCVNSGFGSACDLRCEKECCFSVFCFVFFVLFWFPLVTQFSWPVECGHRIEHVICVQVSLGFFFFWFFVCFFPFCVVLRSWGPACLFLALSVSFFAFFFCFAAVGGFCCLPLSVCVSVRAC